MSNDTTGNYTARGGIKNLDDMPDDALVGVMVKDLKGRLEWLMFCIGQYGFSTFVKFDPFREDNNFTVMVGKYPREDTNDPVGYLSEILRKKRESDEGRR